MSCMWAFTCRLSLYLYYIFICCDSIFQSPLRSLEMQASLHCLLGPSSGESGKELMQQPATCPLRKLATFEKAQEQRISQRCSSPLSCYLLVILIISPFTWESISMSLVMCKTEQEKISKTTARSLFLLVCRSLLQIDIRFLMCSHIIFLSSATPFEKIVLVLNSSTLFEGKVVFKTSIAHQGEH